MADQNLPENHPEPQEEYPRTWRSWFTNTRIVVLSISLLIVAFVVYRGYDGVQDSDRQQAYDEKVASALSAKQSADASPVSMLTSPDGFSEKFDESYFAEFKIEDISMPRNSGSSWSITAAPSQLAFDDPAGFKKQIEYFASFDGIGHLELYKVDGDTLNTSPEDFAGLSDESCALVLRLLQESSLSDAGMSLSVSGLSVSRHSLDAAQSEATFEQLAQELSSLPVDFSYHDKYSAAQVGGNFASVSLDVDSFEPGDVSPASVVPGIFQFDWQRTLTQVEVRDMVDNSRNGEKYIEVVIYLEDTDQVSEITSQEKMQALYQTITDNNQRNVSLYVETTDAVSHRDTILFSNSR